MNKPLSLARPFVTASINETDDTVLFVLKYFILVVQISDAKVKNQGGNPSTSTLKKH